jgi:hypothetical protein
MMKEKKNEAYRGIYFASYTSQEEEEKKNKKEKKKDAFQLHIVRNQLNLQFYRSAFCPTAMDWKFWNITY